MLSESTLAANTEKNIYLNLPLSIKRKKVTQKFKMPTRPLSQGNPGVFTRKHQGDLDADQMKLYELIWNKFISSQMAQAVIDQTTVTSECGGHFFKSTGSIIKFAGFRTVYLEAQAEKKKDKG